MEEYNFTAKSEVNGRKSKKSTIAYQ